MFDLFPVKTGSFDDQGNSYPYEIGYHYDRFSFPKEGSNSSFVRWQELLPPLSFQNSLREGNTPLVKVNNKGLSEDLPPLFVKDESRNPTWSHKDRYVFAALSAAINEGSKGIAVASSGNHGLSAAAYAAQAGLNCTVVLGLGTPDWVIAALKNYGAKVVSTELSRRWELLDRICKEEGHHSVSNRTKIHTGHPFGAEGYKTIAYEIFEELGSNIPKSFFIPVGYGELLFGVAKGFWELKLLKLIDSVPTLYACETKAKGVYQMAVERGLDFITIEDGDSTCARSIAVSQLGYRPIAARNYAKISNIVLDETQIQLGKDFAASKGFYVESSAAVAFAGFLQHSRLTKDRCPSIVISTSTGLKS